jgi:arabinose operon protein AraL
LTQYAGSINQPAGIIFDLDGTIYRGNRLIPGAREALERLRRRGHPMVFVTNAIESRAEHMKKLVELGVPAVLDDIINSPLVLTHYLRREMPGAVLFPISDPPLREELTPYFTLSEDPAEIDVVIASCDRDFSYRKLNIGFQALKRGARFFATNADATWPQSGREIPDAGAIIGALEGCTKRKVELISGKPSPLVTQAALERLGREAQDCWVVGDRVETDILMGHQVGMRTILVLTGVTQATDLDHGPVQPDYVLSSVAGVPQLLERVASNRSGR